MVSQKGVWIKVRIEPDNIITSLLTVYGVDVPTISCNSCKGGPRAQGLGESLRLLEINKRFSWQYTAQRGPIYGEIWIPWSSYFPQVFFVGPDFCKNREYSVIGSRNVKYEQYLHIYIYVIYLSMAKVFINLSNQKYESVDLGNEISFIFFCRYGTLEWNDFSGRPQLFFQW